MVSKLLYTLSSYREFGLPVGSYGSPRGPDSDFVFIFHFSVFIFYVSVFVFYFSVFVLNVLIFTSSSCFLVLVLVFILSFSVFC